MKHTDTKGWTVRDLNGLSIASIRPRAEVEANARLIAAAPDLLAALRKFHQEATAYHTDCGHGLEGSAAECDSICECIAAAELAIARAEGRS